METTLFLLLKFEDSSSSEAQCQFFSDETPVCSEDVEPRYQNLYERTEEVIPPEVYECFDGCYVVACWTCSPEQAEDICMCFAEIEQCKVAAYIWCDEYEQYFVKENDSFAKAPEPSGAIDSELSGLSEEWGEEDREIISAMKSLLNKSDKL